MSIPESDTIGNPLDDATVKLLWRTSSPEAQLRYWDEVSRDSPAWDEDWRDPRAYVVRCANARCWRRVLVVKGRARYCSASCVSDAWYRRNRERVLARQHAYWVRTRRGRVA